MEFEWGLLLAGLILLWLLGRLHAGKRQAAKSHLEQKLTDDVRQRYKVWWLNR